MHAYDSVMTCQALPTADGERGGMPVVKSVSLRFSPFLPPIPLFPFLCRGKIAGRAARQPRKREDEEAIILMEALGGL